MVPHRSYNVDYPARAILRTARVRFPLYLWRANNWVGSGRRVFPTVRRNGKKGVDRTLCRWVHV
ncbi:unnamed protein product [Tuber melanosporum]|uniref:(Perigord truffle) hypothetical protein n=1 Tax=Tuber melanosporum (strain Mel28) TaxID=656061 RepID=D5GD82_TUBMM|nr:uncharacterized protein GSTUM_00006087001 [Tuber melanosporum]CAZ82475.1 unnamed protein product [Tuber melanosporum]